MKTITISKSDFDINNQNSIYAFNKKLQEIAETFEVKFDYPITEIPYDLFYKTKLKSIIFPSSLKIIDPHAFNNTFLEEITLPSFLTKIDSHAFSNCVSLKKILLPNSLESLGTYIFSYCDSLKQITIQMSKKDFLLNIEGAQCFYDEYKDLISFEDKSLDSLLSKNNSIETIINTLELER